MIDQHPHIVIEADSYHVLHYCPSNTRPSWDKEY
jgi:hypothetical protein